MPGSRSDDCPGQIGCAGTIDGPPGSSSDAHKGASASHLSLRPRAHVESYQVDYRSGRTTYFLAVEEAFGLVGARLATAIGRPFDVAALRTAILGTQQGKVLYPQFKRLSQAAGCVGCRVWITGRHVTYWGRQGEVHVERFPD